MSKAKGTMAEELDFPTGRLFGRCLFLRLLQGITATEGDPAVVARNAWVVIE